MLPSDDNVANFFVAVFKLVMEEELVLVCKYGDKICPVVIKGGMDFRAVIEKICRRWTDLDPEIVVMSYSLTNDEPIVMDNDEDLATLIDLLRRHHRRIIGVY